PPKDIDGKSLLSTMLGKSVSSFDRMVFWMRREGGAEYGGQDYYGMRDGQWKLVQNNPFEPFQLFDMSVDSLETNDLKKTNKEIYESLSRKMRVHLQKVGSVQWQK
ncbi:MAG: sulfatase/phosphatase domain-containing protein, partial [Runella zeae]